MRIGPETMEIIYLSCSPFFQHFCKLRAPIRFLEFNGNSITQFTLQYLNTTLMGNRRVSSAHINKLCVLRSAFGFSTSIEYGPTGSSASGGVDVTKACILNYTDELLR